MTHTLRQRDEENVENEEQWRTNLFPKHFPTIVFGPDLITAFSPVIVSQAHLNVLTSPCKTLLNPKLTLHIVLHTSNESRRRVDKPAACA